MPEQNLAPEDQTKWYRDWWEKTGLRFTRLGAAIFLGGILLFWALGYWVVKVAVIHALVEVFGPK